MTRMEQLDEAAQGLNGDRVRSRLLGYLAAIVTQEQWQEALAASIEFGTELRTRT